MIKREKTEVPNISRIAPWNLFQPVIKIRLQVVIRYLYVSVCIYIAIKEKSEGSIVDFDVRPIKLSDYFVFHFRWHSIGHVDTLNYVMISVI